MKQLFKVSSKKPSIFRVATLQSKLQRELLQVWELKYFLNLLENILRWWQRDENL
jgi:hypothetical protein